MILVCEGAFSEVAFFFSSSVPDDSSPGGIMRRRSSSFAQYVACNRSAWRFGGVPFADSEKGTIMLSQIIVPKPSICAPSCILTTSFDLRDVPASSASETKGV